MSPRTTKRWLGALCVLALASASSLVRTQTPATQGLLAHYYAWPASIGCPAEGPDRAQVFDPANLSWARIDPGINQNFGDNPAPNTPSNNFAVTWKGFFVAPDNGDYTFGTRSDDGIRFWIGDSPTATFNPDSGTWSIEAWTPRGVPAADDGPVTVTMTKGAKYPIYAEFFQCGGGDAAYLDYTPPAGTAFVPVPSNLFAPPTSSDTTAPGAITNLAATAITTKNATLTFTAPGDNGATGTAAGYDIRYINSGTLTDANFANATALVKGMHAKAGGSAESITVPINALQSYTVAIRAVDAAGNVGPLSNPITFQTPPEVIDLPTFSTVAKADLAVYYDDAYPTNWVNRAGAQAVRDALVGKGYKLVDATGLFDFMTAHIASKTPSAVVMGNDIFPENVVESSASGTAANLTKDNTVNHYMENNGRVVFMGDWPFYNIGKSDGTNFNPAGTGQCNVLGFCEDGTNDSADAVTPTAAALALGLSSTWKGARPQTPGSVDTTLFTSKGGSAGWIKFFPDRATSTGGGFYRIVDTAVGVPTAAQIADAQKLAEFSGMAGSDAGRVNGIVVDGTGTPVVGATVTLTSGANSVSSTTNVFGGFSALAKPGTYSVAGKANIGGISGSFTSSATANVTANTIAPLLTITITLPALPTLPAPTDKAVYFDPAYGTGWFNATLAGQLHDYLVGKGYTTLDATQMATFMQAHATSKTPSVVVMAQDQAPETIVNITPAADGTVTLTNKNIINDYMNNGGRVIHVGDWPFYNIAKAGATLYNPAGNGAQVILGFNASSGPGDTNDLVKQTAVGTLLGLTSTWQGKRPASANDVDVVLETSNGGAAGWVKLFPNSQGTGAFFRLYDTVDQGALTDAQLADIQKVAEYTGNFSTGGGGGTCKPGDVNGDTNVNVSDAVLALKAAAKLITLTPEQTKAADVVAGGGVNVADAVKILRVAAKIDTLPPTCP